MSATALALRSAAKPLAGRARQPAPPAGFPAAAAHGANAGLAELDRIGSPVTLKRGETLFYEGDPADAYYKVVSGAVRSCKLLADGRRQIGQFFLANDMFGLGRETSSLFSAEAVTDAVLLRYPRQQVDRLVAQDPAVGRCLLSVAARHLVAAHQQMLLLGRKTAEERIASFLLTMAERSGTDGRFALPMTRADIADYLGLTIETVSRSFTQLRNDGLIALRGTSEVAIVDREALEDLADGT
jgi:CRP-like cAMP-binding protein